jgi:hypothetical protein
MPYHSLTHSLAPRSLPMFMSLTASLILCLSRLTPPPPSLPAFIRDAPSLPPSFPPSLKSVYLPTSQARLPTGPSVRSPVYMRGACMHAHIPHAQVLVSYCSRCTRIAQPDGERTFLTCILIVHQVFSRGVTKQLSPRDSVSALTSTQGFECCSRCTRVSRPFGDSMGSAFT